MWQLNVHVGESRLLQLPLLLADAAAAAAVATAAVSVSDRDTVPDALALSCAHLNNYNVKIHYILYTTYLWLPRTPSPPSFLHDRRVQQIQKLYEIIYLYRAGIVTPLYFPMACTLRIQKILEHRENLIYSFIQTD